MRKTYFNISYTIILLSVILLILYSCIINIFPSNFFFASGDFYQITNFDNFFKSFSYTWEDARLGYYNNIFPYKLYYLIISFISSLLSLNPAEIAILNQFIFLSLSFISFNCAIHFFLTFFF